MIFMFSPMSYGRRSSTRGHNAIGPLCTHTHTGRYLVFPSHIRNCSYLCYSELWSPDTWDGMSHYRIKGKFPPHLYPDDHKASATFVYLVTRRSFTFHLLNTQSHDNLYRWHVVFHNTVVYLWNVPSIVAVWQRKQYACVAPKSSDLEGHRLVLPSIEGLEG